jgi:hypothetical protein
MKGDTGRPEEISSRNFRTPFPMNEKIFWNPGKMHVKISPQLRASPQLLLKGFEAPALFHSARIEGF